ncbi:MAG: glycerol-3-phosphate acyltransferase [Actinobacteria bacterium]|nr:glycerol-3-phosphate acyltransferase [Actinomycetota bacterium]
MTTIAAIVAGYLIGSLPTADWLGRLAGVSLRHAGSGNPGANNALRLGGPGLAAAVLLVEMTKGIAAVLAGDALAAEIGAVVAGLGAVAGNVYNVWYRGHGGKGLGITAGVLLAAWPTALLPSLLLIAVVALVTRSSGLAALSAVAGLLVMSLLWYWRDWPTAWGVGNGALLVALAAGVGALMFNRHWRDSPLSGSPPPRLRGPGSPARR